MKRRQSMPGLSGIQTTGLFATLLSTSLLCLVVAGCAPKNEYQPPPPPPVTVAQPVVKTVTNFLEETGTTEPVDMVNIRARVRGFLDKINFEAGTPVKKGDVLYEIQPREYQAIVTAAKAETKDKEVELKRAKIEFDRQTRLFAENATAETKLVQSEADRDAALAALDIAKAALDRAELDLEYTQVKTPIDGRVGKTFVKMGNLVGEGEATHLTTVVKYDPIYANFNISERDYLEAVARKDERQQEGPKKRKVQVFLRRITDAGFPFEGHVEYTDLAVNQSTGTYLVRAIFKNADQKIIPGLFVKLRIPIGTTENAVLVPERAISADQAGKFVLVVGDGNVVDRRNIKTGAKYDHLVHVREGLSPEALVIIDGIQRARPGSTVQPKETSLQPAKGDLESVKQGGGQPPKAAEETSAGNADDEPEANEHLE